VWVIASQKVILRFRSDQAGGADLSDITAGKGHHYSLWDYK